MEFANILTQLRKNKGITQEQLAKVLNITPAAVGLYEQGRRKRIDNETLIKLANYFEVSIDYLYGIEKEDTPIEQPKLTPNFLAYGGSANANTNTKHPTTDFTYAMYEEEKNLTEEDKDELKRMAKILSNKNKGIL